MSPNRYQWGHSVVLWVEIFYFEPTLDACRREYDVRMGWMPINLFLLETLPMEL